MSRIMICGLNGSGKSTLGKALAKEMNYIHKDIEEYYFGAEDNYKYDKPLDRDSVSKMVEADFERYNNIIFTSCKGDYGIASKMCDVAIYINVDKETRLRRVKQRSYDLFGDRILSGGDLFERENKFFDKVYKKDESDVINWFKDLNCDKFEINGLKSTEENVRFILEYLGEKIMDNNYWIDIVNKLIEKKLTIATMESCTGGGIANEITNISGASAILKESYVTYCNEAKIKQGVPAEVIDKYSVYSMETAIEMAKAVKKNAESNYSIGVTGQLGRIDPNNPAPKLNHVWFAIFDNNNNIIQKEIIVPSDYRNKQKEYVINEIAIELVNILK